MVNGSRKSFHFNLFAKTENVVTGSVNTEIFHVVNSEMVGGQFTEMGIGFYYGGSHSVNIDCYARNSNTTTLLATTIVGAWAAFKKVTTASTETYRLLLGDKIYFNITGLGSDLSTPVKGCSTYVTFK